jgi:post-segregation antitoxin (ccd killing protein)
LTIGASNVTIYLPDELAKQAKSANLSLSPICQAAIREELRKIVVKRAVTGDLEAVVARLRATQDKEEWEERRMGLVDGAVWAREFATARELRELAESFEPGRGGDFDREHSLAAFFSARNQEDVNRVRQEDNAYWRGFVDGARDVFEAIGPLL